MYQDDLIVILSFCFVITMGAFSVVAYVMSRFQKRLNFLAAELKAALFKLRIWDALIYGDGADDDLDTGNKRPAPVRRGNVIYLTPPDDDDE